MTDLIILNPIILKILIIFLLSYGIKVLNNYWINYKVTKDSMRINSLVIYVLITFAFIFVYICLFSYWRYFNTTHSRDLKVVIYNIYLAFAKANAFDNFLKIICILLFILLWFYIIILLKKFFFFHFLKLHMFIRYITRHEEDYDKNLYERFISILMDIDSFMHHYLIAKPMEAVYRVYLKYDPQHEKKNRYFLMDLRVKLDIQKLENHFLLFVLIFCFISDILYNMVLSKTYYILLIIFVCNLFSKTLNVICFMYRGDLLNLYDYLYNPQTEIDAEQLEHIDKELLRADTYGKTIYAIDYEARLLIPRITYIFILSLLLILHMLFTNKVRIIILQQQATFFVAIMMIIMIGFLFSSWLFFKKRFIKYIFIFMAVLISIVWFIINHEIPLLFQDSLINNYYIQIIIEYTLQEKLYFFKEYFMFKIQYLNIEQQLYLLKVIKEIPYSELLLDVKINEIKSYVDNFILIYQKIEEII